MTGEGRERDLRKINIDGEREKINVVTRGEGKRIRDQSVNQKGIGHLILTYYLIKPWVKIYEFQISFIYPCCFCVCDELKIAIIRSRRLDCVYCVILFHVNTL